MTFRTDLAVECMEAVGEKTPGVTSEESRFGKVTVSRIRIHSKEGAEALGRPQGRYITVGVPPFSDEIAGEDVITVLRRELRGLIDADGPVLVLGLGNTAITPDSLGPKVARRVLATRHITGEVARRTGLEDLRRVAVLAPGVLGQTGVETGEILGGVVDRIQPSAVLVVDALASRRLNRLGCTVQMSDTGIAPGSGIGNRRMKINEETVGVPVISVGVPTVVD
ncbi:MAG: GPR endopeptidase, partial [Clostridia bacterium]|nr:GPR endopeptidase [Clostridia bacterium]